MRDTIDRLLIVSWAWLCGVGFCACSSDEEDSYTEVKKIQVTVADMVNIPTDSPPRPEMGWNVTRSFIQPNAAYTHIDYMFEDHDTLGIFPQGGFEIPFVVEIPDKIPVTKVTIEADGWLTKDGVKYCSYLPFDRYNFDYSYKIPWSWAGQVQTGNDNASHTGKFMLLATLPNETNEDGTFNAHLTHMGTVIFADLGVPNLGTFKKVCMVAPSARFALNGRYDLFTDGQPFTAGTMSDHFDVLLNNFSVTDTGWQYASIWFVLSPDISFAQGENLIFYLWDDAGYRYRGTYTHSKATTYVRNGYAYISINMTRESNNISTYINDYHNEDSATGVAIE